MESGIRNYNLLFSQMLDFNYMAHGVDDPNKNNIITPCLVDLVDLFNQTSIVRDNLSPFTRKYFKDFLANICINNRHINNNHSWSCAN